MTSYRSTTAHVLTFDVPTWSDYRKGGFGDLVAQCSCGAHEYTYSRTEGAYWHGLHAARPSAHPGMLLVDAPMPEGWTVPAPEVSAPSVAATGIVRPRAWTCPTCSGSGAVAAYGAQGGHFYQLGDRAACVECAGSGSVNEFPSAALLGAAA